MRNILYLDGRPLTVYEFAERIVDVLGLLMTQVEIVPPDADIPIVRFSFRDAVRVFERDADGNIHSPGEHLVSIVAEIPVVTFDKMSDDALFGVIEDYIRAQQIDLHRKFDKTQQTGGRADGG